MAKKKGHPKNGRVVFYKQKLDPESTPPWVHPSLKKEQRERLAEIYRRRPDTPVEWRKLLPSEDADKRGVEDGRQKASAGQ